MSSVCTVWTVFTVLYVTFCYYIECENVSNSHDLTMANTSSNQLKYPLSTHFNDGKSDYDGRDVVGYGGKPPKGKTIDI